MKALIKIERENIVPFIISSIFHPIFAPAIGAWLILSSTTYQMLLNDKARLYVGLVVFGFTVFIPLILLPLMYLFRLIRSIQMDERSERIIPLLLNAIVYYAVYSFFKHQQLLIFINLFLLAILVATIVAAITSWFWKISLHAIAWGGLTALAMFMSMVGYLPSIAILFTIIVIAGLVSTARLYMQVHNPLQIGMGILLGFVSVVFFLVFFPQFISIL